MVCLRCGREIKVASWKEGQGGRTNGAFYPHKENSAKWCKGSYEHPKEQEEILEKERIVKST